MHLAERVRHRAERPRGERRFSVKNYIEQCSPDYEANSLLQLTPSFLRNKKVKALFLDAEGTFVGFGDTLPDPKVASHIRSLKEQHPDLKIAIVTNKKPKDPASMVALTHWGNELDADVVVTPLDPLWRKPSPRMIQEAMSYLGIPEEEARTVLMIGDKRTGDVIAGKRAGTQTMWVNKIVGQYDLLGDRLVRRPVERFMAKHSSGHGLLTLHEANREMLEEQLDIDRPLAGPADHNWWNKTDLDKMQQFANKLLGYGTPYEGQIRNTIAGSEWLYEHGGQVADLISYSQVVLAFGAALAEVGKKPKLAAALKTLAALADALDGFVGKRSKRGGTAKSAALDQKADKAAGKWKQAGMVLAGTLSYSDLGLRVGSDTYMNRYIRPPLEKRGIDISAVWPGKVATGISNVADIISPLLKSEHPEAAELVNEIATVVKIARLPLNTQYIELRHQLRQEQEPHLNRIYQELLQAA